MASCGHSETFKYKNDLINITKKQIFVQQTPAKILIAFPKCTKLNF